MTGKQHITLHASTSKACQPVRVDKRDDAACQRRGPLKPRV